MFLGTYYLLFSGKGRLILPKKFRSQLSKPEITLIKGIDGGIWGFAEEKWQELSNKQLEIGVLEAKGRGLRRRFFPYAEVCELDEQGRFVISEFLLKEVGLKENLVLIGAGDHFEIWELKKWVELKKELGDE